MSLRTSAVLAVLALAGCTSTRAWFTASDDVTSVLVGEVGAAAERIDVAIYTFTDPDIRDALADAASVRGVDVRLCADAEQTWTLSDQRDALDALAQAGAEVRVGRGHQGGILHHKFLVIDEREVLTGSFNFTPTAQRANDENLLVLVQPELADQYTAAFEELWGRCEAP